MFVTLCPYYLIFYRAKNLMSISVSFGPRHLLRSVVFRTNLTKCITTLWALVNMMNILLRVHWQAWYLVNKECIWVFGTLKEKELYRVLQSIAYCCSYRAKHTNRDPPRRWRPSDGPEGKTSVEGPGLRGTGSGCISRRTRQDKLVMSWDTNGMPHDHLTWSKDYGFTLHSNT